MKSIRFTVFAHYTIMQTYLKKYWTYEILVRYILSCVCLRLSLFSQVSLMQYMVLRVFSLPSLHLMVTRIFAFHLVIIIRSEIRIVGHCLKPGNETISLLPDKQNCRLRMRRKCRERFLRHHGLAIPTCITARASRTCRDACQDR